jgi:hypothetical protein
MAALGAGLTLESIAEHSPDEALPAKFPRASKYVGWPMLVALRCSFVDDAVKKLILSRRARFIAAAVGGIVACEKPPQPLVCLEPPRVEPPLTADGGEPESAPDAAAPTVCLGPDFIDPQSGVGAVDAGPPPRVCLRK